MSPYARGWFCETATWEDAFAAIFLQTRMIILATKI